MYGVAKMLDVVGTRCRTASRAVGLMPICSGVRCRCCPFGVRSCCCTDGTPRAEQHGLYYPGGQGLVYGVYAIGSLSVSAPCNCLCRCRLRILSCTRLLDWTSS